MTLASLMDLDELKRYPLKPITRAKYLLTLLNDINNVLGIIQNEYWQIKSIEIAIIWHTVKNGTSDFLDQHWVDPEKML